MKIVINDTFGGFGLSYEGVMKYAELKNIKLYAFVDGRNEVGNLDFHAPKIPYDGTGDAFIVHYSQKPLKDGKYEEDSYFSERDIERTDPALIKTVKLLGKKANGRCASLKIIEIPDNVEWQVEEYDGLEHIAEKHQTWN